MNSREKKITQMIKAKIKQKDPEAEIILYGSHARGDARKDSDWDILILINKSQASHLLEMEYRNELYSIELETGEIISTYVFSKEEWKKKFWVTPFYENVTSEGIYL